MSSNIGDKMQIKCTCGRFLLEINIEEYIGELEKLDIEQQTPIVVSLPCKFCKNNWNIEIYKVRFNLKPNKRH